jgi:hypothetical protein
VQLLQLSLITVNVNLGRTIDVSGFVLLDRRLSRVDDSRVPAAQVGYS